MKIFNTHPSNNPRAREENLFSSHDAHVQHLRAHIDVPISAQPRSQHDVGIFRATTLNKNMNADNSKIFGNYIEHLLEQAPAPVQPRTTQPMPFRPANNAPVSQVPQKPGMPTPLNVAPPPNATLLRPTTSQAPPIPPIPAPVQASQTAQPQSPTATVPPPAPTTPPEEIRRALPANAPFLNSTTAPLRSTQPSVNPDEQRIADLEKRVEAEETPAENEEETQTDDAWEIQDADLDPPKKHRTTSFDELEHRTSLFN